MRLGATKTGATTTYNGLGDQLYDLGGARPTLDLNFASNGSLVDSVTGKTLVTHTRASSATYVDGDGIIQTAGNNVPRFDHNPTTGESLGLLVEESRTNLVEQSEDLTSWLTTSATKIYDANAVAPDGTLGVWIGANASGTGLSSRVQPPTVSYTAGTVYTVSVFCKAKEVDTVAVFFNSPDFGYKYAANYVNLNTGAVGGSNPQFIKVEPLPNEWYRISVSQAATASGTSYLLAVAPGSTGDVNNLAGNGVDGIYIWGAQVEAGSFPTSYIRTNGSTVTRSADVTSITGTNFSSWYNQTEGTVFSDSNIIATGQTQLVWRLTGGTYSTSLRQPHSTGTQFRAVIGDTFSASPGTGGTIPGVTKAAVSFSGTAGRFQVGTSGVDVTASGAPDPNTLNLGTYTASTHLNGTIARLTYWPTRLSNDTLQTITV